MSQTVLNRPDLYGEDFAAWIDQQVENLRARRFEALDLPNLIEELEAMGRSERRELQSRLEVLLVHLLKWDHQPAYRSRSWELTIEEQRRRVRELLGESPSLRRVLNEAVSGAYRGAVVEAMRQTGLDQGAFPPSVPYDLNAILGEPATDG